MRFRVLGPLAVSDGISEVTPTAPKVRQVLAFLLVRPRKFVHVGEFIEELWGENPPRSAMTTLQTYIYKLRKDVIECCPSVQLHTRASGYILDVAPENGDLFAFERLTADGRAALEAGDAAKASGMLAEALALWRGSPLADVEVGEILSAYVTRLHEDRLRALELRIEADLQLGRDLHLISELKTLVAGHPLHERFYGFLMLTLHRSGRRYEALGVYQALRRTLVEELGLEPSASVQGLHRALLSSDPSVEGAPAAARPAQPDGDAFMVPAQLPPDVPDFAGREEPVRQVRDYLRREAADGTVRAVAVSGMPGIGKTAFALRVAHLERSAFPDGQLFADLRGTSSELADPYEILAGFARAVGIPSQQIPQSLEERSGLFRTWCTDRRVLAVLDDAESVQQVLPLLPAAPGCAVIVTGRSGLYGLPGARHVELAAFSPEEGVDLLERVVGSPSVSADRPTATRIVRLCGNLPLAVRTAGARIAAMGTWRLDKMAARLEADVTRLDMLNFDGSDIRARFGASYQQLHPADRSLFRLLSLLPAAGFTATTVASLTGGDSSAIETQLIRLVECHLLEISQPSGEGEIRYSLHVLTRLYARERLELEFVNPGKHPEQPARCAPAQPDTAGKPAAAKHDGVIPAQAPAGTSIAAHHDPRKDIVAASAHAAPRWA